MNAVKNVGSGAVDEIIRAREIDGRFDSLEDFFSKVSPRIVNRKGLESLIKSGAFSEFADRSLLINNVDNLLAYANRIQKEKNSGQTDLFGNLLDADAMTPKLVLDDTGPSYTTRDELLWERELLGLYLSSHPLEQFKLFLEEQTVPFSSLKPEHDAKSVTVGGIVVDFREITTKNGQKMGFVKLADHSAEAELVLFPSIYQQTLGIWERDRVLLVKGKVNGKDRAGNIHSDLKILVDDAREVTEEQAVAYSSTGKKPKVPKPSVKKAEIPKQDPDDRAPMRMYIRISSSDDTSVLIELKKIVDNNLGDIEVVLVIGGDDNKQVLKLPQRINSSDEVTNTLKILVGDGNVKYQ